MIQQVDQKTK